MNEEEKVLCPNCGGRSELNSSYCIFCGKEIKKEKKSLYKKIIKKVENNPSDKTELLEEQANQEIPELLENKPSEEIDFLEEQEVKENEETKNKENASRFVDLLISIVVIALIFFTRFTPIFIIVDIILAMMYIKIPRAKKILNLIISLAKNFIIFIVVINLILLGTCFSIFIFYS